MANILLVALVEGMNRFSPNSDHCLALELKMYSPFPTELTNTTEGENLQKIGREFGATTGRTRRSDSAASFVKDAVNVDVVQVWLA